MKLKFLRSSARWYYIFAALRFGKTPWNIYRIAHSDEYLANTKDRIIHDDYCHYRNRKKRRR